MWPLSALWIFRMAFRSNGPPGRGRASWPQKDNGDDAVALPSCPPLCCRSSPIYCRHTFALSLSHSLTHTAAAARTCTRQTHTPNSHAQLTRTTHKHPAAGGPALYHLPSEFHTPCDLPARVRLDSPSRPPAREALELPRLLQRGSGGQQVHQLHVQRLRMVPLPHPILQELRLRDTNDLEKMRITNEAHMTNGGLESVSAKAALKWSGQGTRAVTTSGVKSHARQKAIACDVAKAPLLRWSGGR